MSKWPAAFFARGLWCYADALEGSMDAYGRVPGVKEMVVVRGPHAFTTWPDTERKRVASRMIAFGRAAVLGVPLEGGRPWSDMKQLVATSRSEEHTSDLQSLMRISYAVSCLKKKNNK